MTSHWYTDPDGDQLWINDRHVTAYDKGDDESASVRLPDNAEGRAAMARAILAGTGAYVATATDRAQAAERERDRHRAAWTSARQRAAAWRREAESRPTSTVHECCEQAQDARAALTRVRALADEWTDITIGPVTLDRDKWLAIAGDNVKHVLDDGRGQATAEADTAEPGDEVPTLTELHGRVHAAEEGARYLAEHIGRDVSRVEDRHAEHVRQTARGYDRIVERVDGLSRRMDDAETASSDHSRLINEAHDGMRELSRRMGRVEADTGDNRHSITDAEGVIGSVRDRLDEMERRAKESVLSLRERVVDLEAGLDPVNTERPTESLTAKARRLETEAEAPARWRDRRGVVWQETADDHTEMEAVYAPLGEDGQPINISGRIPRTAITAAWGPLTPVTDDEEQATAQDDLPYQVGDKVRRINSDDDRVRTVTELVLVGPHRGWIVLDGGTRWGHGPTDPARYEPADAPDATADLGNIFGCPSCRTNQPVKGSRYRTDFGQRWCWICDDATPEQPAETPAPCPVCGLAPADQEYGPTGTCRHTTATRVHRTDGIAESGDA